LTFGTGEDYGRFDFDSEATREIAITSGIV